MEIKTRKLERQEGQGKKQNKCCVQTLADR
jgi:hypothetical protein